MSIGLFVVVVVDVVFTTVAVDEVVSGCSASEVAVTVVLTGLSVLVDDIVVNAVVVRFGVVVDVVTVVVDEVVSGHSGSVKLVVSTGGSV